MAGHGVVLVALTLATWSLCLLHSTGQEVSPGSSVEEIVAKCSGRIPQSLCDPQGVLTAEEELEIRRSLADIERTSFARNSRICGPSGQHLNATVVVLPVAPKPSTSSLDREDTVNSLIQALLPDRTICSLLAIFVMDPAEVYWIMGSGNYSGDSYMMQRRSLNMTTEDKEPVKIIQQSLYEIMDTGPDEPYHLPRGSYGIGKAGGTAGEVNTIGWEGDWTTMLYLGAGLGSIILILSISVCCVSRKWKQERKLRAQIEAASASGAMVPVWDYGVPVVLKPPVMPYKAIQPMRYYNVPRREQVIV